MYSNMQAFAELITRYWYIPLMLILGGILVWAFTLIARGLGARSKDVHESTENEGGGAGTLLITLLLLGAIGVLAWLFVRRYL